MRLCRVMVDDVAEPVLALERDGALYDVAELDRAFDTRLSPERLASASDLHVRAFALAGAGLHDLDERLRAGDRPSAARLLPGTFAWLAPCDTERARLVLLAPHDLPSTEPLHRLGDARALLGHTSAVPYPDGELRAVVELGLAVVLRESVRACSPAEAEAAILGVTILNAWSRAAPPAAHGWESARVPGQLGPWIATMDEVGELGRLRAQIRVDGEVRSAPEIGCARHTLARSIAALSRQMELCAGDVIGAGTALGGRLEVAFGARIEAVVERLGKLEGRPLGGP